MGAVHERSQRMSSRLSTAGGETLSEREKERGLGLEEHGQSSEQDATENQEGGFPEKNGHILRVTHHGLPMEIIGQAGDRQGVEDESIWCSPSAYTKWVMARG